MLFSLLDNLSRDFLVSSKSSKLTMVLVSNTSLANSMLSWNSSISSSFKTTFPILKDLIFHQSESHWRLSTKWLTRRFPEELLPILIDANWFARSSTWTGREVRKTTAKTTALHPAWRTCQWRLSRLLLDVVCASTRWLLLHWGIWQALVYFAFFRKAMIQTSDCDGFYNKGVHREEDTKQHLSAVKGNSKGKCPLCIVLSCLTTLTRDQTKDEEHNGDTFQHVACGE